MTKNRVNNIGLEVFDECPKPMGMENRKNMSRKGFKG